MRILGLDIGGTKCAVLLGKYDKERLTIEGKAVLPTDRAKEPQAVFEAMCCEADRLLEGDVPDGIGTVSYTHLDVYKRQHETGALSRGRPPSRGRRT